MWFYCCSFLYSIQLLELFSAQQQLKKSNGSVPFWFYWHLSIHHLDHSSNNLQALLLTTALYMGKAKQLFTVPHQLTINFTILFILKWRKNKSFLQSWGEILIANIFNDTMLHNVCYKTPKKPIAQYIGHAPTQLFEAQTQ